MEIEELIKNLKVIHLTLIDFIDATDDSDADVEFQKLIMIFEKQEILQNKEAIKLIFQLISKIADNHHQLSDFFNKLEKIFQFLIKDSPSPISYFISDYTNLNRRFLFFLLEKKIIIPDQSFLNYYLKSKSINIQLYYYLYPTMKNYIDESIKKQIEDEIQQKFEEDISIYEEKCKIGQNDSYICSLIREDLVEEFISYVNRTNFHLSTKIKSSIYEINSILIDKELTIIEYASFFGSIQIIRYLKYNNVQLTSSLWLYAIHSNSAELIHFLEENKINPKRNEIKQEKKEIRRERNVIIQPMHIFRHRRNNNNILGMDEFRLRENITRSERNGIVLNNNNKPNKIKEQFEYVFIESIKCHHNNISNYIKDNLLNQYKAEQFNSYIFDSLNFCLFPDDIVSMICNHRIFSLSQLYLLITQIAIPFPVTSIGNYAFNGCSSLTQVLIPSFVTSIGNNALSGCSSLKQITIPSSVTSIGNYAFNGCSLLTQIVISSSVTTIGDSTFKGCSSLAQITIPSSVTSIGNYAFNECSSLTQIIIPSSVISIGNYTFSDCSSLTEVNIPSSVTSIGKGAFLRCSSLIQITIPSSITQIENYSFSKCSSLKQVSIPSSVKKIKICAFEGCSSLTQISIFSSEISIESDAFNGCLSLPPRLSPNFNKQFSDSNDSLPLILSNDKNNSENSMNEFNILKTLNHPSIIKALCISFKSEVSSIEFEFCPTNLQEVVLNKKFSKVKLVYSIYQIAEGMKYIHSQKIIHLDLNPTNILISEEGTIKICGFQNAQKMTTENENEKMEDVYSFGTIVCFILNGNEINKREKEAVLKSFSSIAQQLIEKCFYDDSIRRPTFEMILYEMEKNKFNLISLSQQEIEEVSKLIAQFKKQITS